MKKQLIVALAIMVSAFSFAQKKELKSAEKAIKGNNFSEAKAALKQAEALLSSADAKTQSKYYFLNAKALYANGAGTNADFDAALESLGKVQGYVAEISELKQGMVNTMLTKGNEAYEKKDYSTSSTYFENAYRVSPKDTTYLYYAASTAVSVQEYDRALKLYEELKQMNYTGIKTEYYAINVESNENEMFNDKTLRDLSVKAKTHTTPTEKVTESKKAEIVKNVALIYVSNGDNENAIKAIKDARDASPDDVNLIITEANIHLEMGDKDKFNELLKFATEKDPDNAILQYNLGVIAAESKDNEAAKKYYERAIELDPTYVNTYINMAALILESEQTIIEEMNGLGTSAADDKRYDELRAERQNLYRSAIPYLESALQHDSKSINAAKTLMNIFSVLGETDKFKDMKQKVADLEAGN